MTGFFARRLGFGALVLFVLSIFVFMLCFVAPGDRARMIAGEKATEAHQELIRSNLGVDRPIVEQYGRFVGKA